MLTECGKQLGGLISLLKWLMNCFNDDDRTMFRDAWLELLVNTTKASGATVPLWYVLMCLPLVRTYKGK